MQRRIYLILIAFITLGILSFTNCSEKGFEVSDELTSKSRLLGLDTNGTPQDPLNTEKIEQGKVYTLASACHDDLVLGLTQSSEENGQALSFSNLGAAPEAEQLFSAEADIFGHFRLKNLKSHKYFHLAYGSTEIDSPLLQRDYLGLPQQSFIFDLSDDGYYRIKTFHSGLYLQSHEVSPGETILVQKDLKEELCEQKFSLKLQTLPDPLPSPQNPPLALDSIPYPSDSRVLWWVDSASPLAESSVSRLVSLSLPEVSSPFQHFFDKDTPRDAAGNLRSEFSSPDQAIERGEEVWIAFALKLNTDLLDPANPGLSLFEIKRAANFEAEDQIINSHLQFYLFGPEFKITQRSSIERINTPSNTMIQDLWVEQNPSTVDWQKFILKAKFHYDENESPYVKIWRQVGQGSLELIADHQGPNIFWDDDARLPVKIGLFQWDTSWSGADTRTLLNKGIFVLKETEGSPQLNEQVLLNLLNSR